LFGILIEIAQPCQYAMYPPVQFRRKLKKLINGEGLKSARRHLRSSRASRFTLETDRVMQTIDREEFEAIRKIYAVDDPGEDWPKYLDLDRWIDINIRRVRRLDLDFGPPKRILDLGCGAGYFAYIAQLLGHNVMGLDVADVPMFADMTELFGIQRAIWRIEPFVPLPDLKRKFDLITAFMICFNNHKHADLWGMPEWNFFLDDVAKHLTPGGRVWLELNREYDGTCYTPELKQLFEQRGAEIDNHRVVFSELSERHPHLNPLP
jgi:SAM-dependent methyltransferase